MDRTALKIAIDELFNDKERLLQEIIALKLKLNPKKLEDYFEEAITRMEYLNDIIQLKTPIKEGLLPNIVVNSEGTEIAKFDSSELALIFMYFINNFTEIINAVRYNGS